MLYNSCFLTLDALLMSRNYSPDHHTMYHFSSNDPSSRTEKRITSLPVSPHQHMLLIAPPVPGVNADSHKHSSFSKFILSIVTLCSLPFTAAYLKVLLSKPTPDSISCHEKAYQRNPGLFLFSWFLQHFHGNYHKKPFGERFL